jgi:hypothetical protein
VPLELYVSSTASDGAAGTIADPMTLAEATEYPLTPGSTVYLATGTYTGDFSIKRSGKYGHNITWTPTTQGSRVTIDGSIFMDGSYNTLDGIEITDTGFTDRTSVIETPTPGDVNGQMILKNYGSGNKFLHCHLKNGMNGYVSNAYVDGFELAGSIIQYNGWYIADHTWGHGVYSNNIGERYSGSIRGNISLYNFGIGIGLASNGYAAYSDCERVTIADNIAFDNGVPNGVFKSNFVAHCGGTIPIASLAVTDNISYTSDRADISAAVGPVGEIAGVGYVAATGACTGNMFISAKAAVDAFELGDFTGPVTGNTIMGGLVGFDLITYPDNAVVVAVPAGVHVYPDEYDTTRCNVAILNPSGANTVAVNLSSVTGLAVGDDVEVHNAEDYWVDIQTLTLDASKQIAVNMEAANRTVEAPVGWATPTTCCPRFGAFVVIKA